MNVLLLYTILGLSTFLIIYTQRKCWYFVWQINGWLGVLQQPLLWFLLIFSLHPKTLMSSMKKYRYLIRTFPMALIFLDRVYLYVDDPDNMESILTAPECLNKPFHVNAFCFNKGLLHAKDEQWKLRRKQLSPVFSNNNLASLFKTYNRLASALKIKISETSQKSSQIEFNSLNILISGAALDVSCVATMGYEAHLLENDDKGIVEAFKYLMSLNALTSIKFWYHIDLAFRLLDNKNYKKAKKANKLFAEFIAKIVQQKHIEYQQQQQLLTTNTKFNDNNVSGAIATNTAKDRRLLNEQDKSHKFSGTTIASATSSAANDVSFLANTSALPERNETVPIPRQRIFIDQLLYLAQAGKITMEDIINESKTMVFLSFESVSTFIMSTLLLLAINREHQTKLRNEIKQILQLSKDKTNNKDTATITSTKHHNDDAKSNSKIKKTATLNTNTSLGSDWDSKMTSNLDGIAADVNNSNGNNSTFDGCNDDGVNAGIQVTTEHLLNMPYLDMIIEESLRLLAIVPINARMSSVDFKLNVKQQEYEKDASTQKNNINNNNTANLDRSYCTTVPKGTIFVLDVFNMQRNEKYWGKNALKFYPEHFIGKHQQQQEHQGTEQSIKAGENKQETENVPTAAAASRHSFDFIPFSKGLRNCIGYRYSYYLSKVMLIHLISSFEFSTNVQLEDLEFEEAVSLNFLNPEKILFEIKPVNCTSSQASSKDN